MVPFLLIARSTLVTVVSGFCCHYYFFLFYSLSFFFGGGGRRGGSFSKLIHVPPTDILHLMNGSALTNLDLRDNTQR